MRLLRSFFNWGLCPQAPGIYRFFPARMGMILRGRLRATAAVAPMPFRPLNRSLGLLPSIALSRPAQVSSVSTEAVRYPIQKQRTVITLLIRCLTFGVHSKTAIRTPSPPPLASAYDCCQPDSSSSGARCPILNANSMSKAGSFTSRDSSTASTPRELAATRVHSSQ